MYAQAKFSLQALRFSSSLFLVASTHSLTHSLTAAGAVQQLASAQCSWLKGGSFLLACGVDYLGVV